MSRSRTALPLAAAAVLLALALALAACGGGDGDESAGKLLDSATLEGVESADLGLSLEVNAKGREGGRLRASLSGPFEGGAEGDLPRLDMTAEAKGRLGGERIDFDGGLVLLPNSAFVSYEGTDYEVDPTTFSFVESAIEQSEREGGESGGATACQERAAQVDVAEFVEDASNEGGASVGGAETTKVSGELAVGSALDALLEVARSPACKSQLGAAGPLPSEGEIEEARDEIEASLKRAQVEVYVGDDDIVRRLAGQLTVEPQGGGEGPSRLEVDFDLQLSGVNEEQQITPPRRAKPIGELFIELGVNPIELLGLLQGEGGEGLGGLLEGLGGAAR